MPPADGALIAEACSPEGGLLDLLASQVEGLERDAYRGACQRCGVQGVPIRIVKKAGALPQPLRYAIWCAACVEANVKDEGRHLTDGIDVLAADNARLRKALEGLLKTGLLQPAGDRIPLVQERIAAAKAALRGEG